MGYRKNNKKSIFHWYKIALLSITKMFKNCGSYFRIRYETYQWFEFAKILEKKDFINADCFQTKMHYGMTGYQVQGCTALYCAKP